MQLSHQGQILGRGNRVTLGVAYDGHQTRFTQREAASDLVPRGNSVGTRRTGAFETEVDVDTRQDNIGVYLTDTFDLGERVALTLAGRYQHVHITLRDRSDENPALNGSHSFDRFSPAVGVTVKAHALLTLFASYSEGFRAPTPAELTCADPNAPCKLPNAFLADPPLHPVIARTYEIGARGKVPFGETLQWSVGFFRTDLEDDLLFTTVQTGGSGFFQNVDRTRRQGVEAGVSGTWDRLKYFLNYAYIDATYETDTTLASVTAADGVLPGVPLETVKMDPTRMAQGIMTGIGFLGAGVIYKEGASVRGLTTAASIWLTAAIGILFGIGFYFPAVLATGFALGILAAFRWFEARIPAQVYAYHYIRFQRHNTMAEKELRDLLTQHGFSIANMAYRVIEEGQVFEYRMVIRTTDPTNTSRLADDLRQLELVREFRIAPTGD